MKLTSTAFENGNEIPTEFSQLGDNVSPPLTISDIPEGTKSLALIVLDPDAPNPEAEQKQLCCHLIAYNIRPKFGSDSVVFGPKAFNEGSLNDAKESCISFGRNEWSLESYKGPNPPSGKHRYFFLVFALKDDLQFENQPTKLEFLAAIKHAGAIASAEFMGTFEKPAAEEDEFEMMRREMGGRMSF